MVQDVYAAPCAHPPKSARLLSPHVRRVRRVPDETDGVPYWVTGESFTCETHGKMWIALLQEMQGVLFFKCFLIDS